MKTFSIKDAVKHGWTLFKANKKILVLATLLFIILSNLNNQGRMGWGRYHSGFSPLVWLVLFAVSIIVKIGWMKIMLCLEEGEKPHLKELFTHLEIFWRYLGVYIIYIAAVMIGFVLLIIPGIYVALKYSFAPILILDKKGLKISEAFKQSAVMSQNIKWKLLGLFVVMIFLNILGAVALIVGLLVSIPVSTLAFVHIYKGLLNRPA